MGFAFCMGGCCICKVTFNFNPDRVPSIRINGEKEPICRACHADINKLRESKGLPTFPLAQDAYGLAEWE